ncbi:unnamed protein product [Orchesella dallaii]|uniref:Uncharacterized protein n=1 Tax=Orchesella dallaii TaxID=48710 RepID=A0ABP1PN86_9HEXA
MPFKLQNSKIEQPSHAKDCRAAALSPDEIIDEKNQYFQDLFPDPRYDFICKFFMFFQKFAAFWDYPPC